MRLLRNVNLFMAAVLLCEFAAALAVNELEAAYGAEFGYDLKILIFQPVALLVPAWVFMRRGRLNPGQVFPVKALDIKNCVYILAMSLLAVPVMQVLSALTPAVFQTGVPGVVNEIYRQRGGVFVSLIGLALMPALCEEIVMRGVVRKGYEAVDLRRAALVSGLFFAFLHLNAGQFVYAFPLGVFFAYFVSYTKSMIAPVLAHFAVNAASVFLAFSAARLSDAGKLDFMAELPGAAGFMFAATVCFALLCAGLFYFVFRSFSAYNRPGGGAAGPAGFDYDYELVIESAAVKLIKARPIIPEKTRVLTPSFFVVCVVYALLTALNG